MLKIICPHCHGEKVDLGNVEVLSSHDFFRPVSTEDE